MLTFKDGPAAGQTLSLRRAPRFLRITQRRFVLTMTLEPGDSLNSEQEFDGLDHPGDAARHNEILHAYETKKFWGCAHIRYGGSKKHLSGFYPIAEYTYVEPQPDDDTMRDNAKWVEWCNAQPPFPQ